VRIPKERHKKASRERKKKGIEHKVGLLAEVCVCVLKHSPSRLDSSKGMKAVVPIM